MSTIAAKPSSASQAWVDRAITISVSILALLGIILSFLRTGITAAIFYSFGIAIYAALFVRVVLHLKRITQGSNAAWPWRHPILFSAAIALAAGTILEFLTLIGAPASSPFSLEDWGKKRLLVFAAICFLATPIMFHCHPRTVDERVSIRLKTSSVAGQLQTLPILAGTTLLFSFLAALVCGVFTWDTEAVINRALLLLIYTIFGALIISRLVKKIAERPELAFVVIALLAGSYLSFSLPAITGTSWDGQIHFDRSLGLSYLTSSEYGDAEIMLVNLPAEQFSNPDQAMKDLDAAYQTEIAQKQIATRTGLFSPVAGESLLNINTIGYIPSAIGLWLGRLLRLPINGIFILGRWMNAICYSCVMACAIRIIPFKKLLLFAIGLLPTSIYLASNYSYDPWVTAFLSLGIAMILNERSENGNEKLSSNRILLIMLVIFIGLCPKAIYFPVIAMMYLIPSSRFADKRDYRKYCFAVFVFGCLMFASFVLPMVFSQSAQAGDARGGEDVNALGQIMFILSNPIEYLSIMARFLSSYIFTNSASYSLSYSYMQALIDYLPQLINIPLVYLILAAILDGREQSAFNVVQSVLLFALFLFTILLVATSLYVSFTPVGLDTVNGCQHRYLLPALFIPLSLVNLPICRKRTSYKTVAICICNATAIIACDLLVVYAPVFS